MQEPGGSDNKKESGKEEGGQETESKDVEDIKAVAILISSASQTTTGQGNAMQAYAENLGLDFSVQYYDQNIATEEEMIENAVTAGTDVMIVQNQSDGDCVDALNKAAEAGVKIVLYGQDIPDVDYTYLLAEDSVEAGRTIGKLAADWANENLVAKGEPVIAAIGNYTVSPIAVERNEGIMEILKEECPEAEVVGTYEMAYKQEGLEVGENILQAHPDVNLVIGINDQSVCGVYEAFTAAGLGNENIGMFGIDGTDEAMYNISKNDLFKGVSYFPVNRIGEQMVQYGVDNAKGSEDAPKDKIIYWSFEDVTYDNIEEYKDIWGYLAE